MRAIGSYQMGDCTRTSTPINHGHQEGGSAGARVNEEANTCEGIKQKENNSGDRSHR